MLSIFTGSVVDRVGPKKGFLFGVFCLGLMSLLFGLSPTYAVLLVLAVIAGLGFSIITPSVNKGVMIETPPDKRALSMGIMQSGVGIGGLAGATLLPLLGEHFGWRTTIQFTGIFILVMGLLAFKLYHESSGNSGSAEDRRENQDKKPYSLKDNLRFFLTQKQFIILCLFGVVLGGTTVGTVLPHFTVFLTEDLLMSPAVAGLGLGIFQIGGMLGRPAWGWLSDNIFKGHRGKTLFLTGLAAGIMFLVTGFLSGGPSSPVIVYSFSFILGFASFSWFGIFFIAAGEFGGVERAGAATGLSLLSLRLGVLAAPPIFGLIADTYKNYSYSWLAFGAVIILVSAVFYLVSVKGDKASLQVSS